MPQAGHVIYGQLWSRPTCRQLPAPGSGDRQRNFVRVLLSAQLINVGGAAPNWAWQLQCVPVCVYVCGCLAMALLLKPVDCLFGLIKRCGTCDMCSIWCCTFCSCCCCRFLLFVCCAASLALTAAQKLSCPHQLALAVAGPAVVCAPKSKARMSTSLSKADAPTTATMTTKTTT